MIKALILQVTLRMVAIALMFQAYFQKHEEIGAPEGERFRTKGDEEAAASA